MTLWYSSGGVDIHVGHVLDVLAALPAGSIQTCVTSPPYYGLRSYSTTPQIWGGSPDCDHSLEATAPGKVLTGGTGTASAKQVSNAGSQYANEAAALGRAAGLPEAEVAALQARAERVGSPYGNAWAEVHPPGYRSSDTHPGPLQSAGNTNRERFGSRVCTRCGAWSGELGSEPIPDCLALLRGEPPCSQCFVCHLVTVFRAVRRVLHDTGVCWINLGDSYNSSAQYNNQRKGEGSGRLNGGARYLEHDGSEWPGHRALVPSLGPKQLMMMPARVALALQADGWVLRSDIIWAKPNPMPESVTDRPTTAHEHLFLLSKRADYYYDATAIAEPTSDLTAWKDAGRYNAADKAARAGITTNGTGASTLRVETAATRNRRSVWTIPTEAFSGAHFAVFPRALVTPCVLAGTSARGQCPACGAPWRRVVSAINPSRTRLVGVGVDSHEGTAGRAGAVETRTTGWAPTCGCRIFGRENAGDPTPQTVLDPFLGSGTTAYVARHHGRRAIGIELSESYAKLAADRLQQGTLGLEVY